MGIKEDFLNFTKWGATKFTDLFTIPFVNGTNTDGLKWHLQEIRQKTYDAIAGLHDLITKNYINTPNGSCVILDNINPNNVLKSGEYYLQNAIGTPDRDGYLKVYTLSDAWVFQEFTDVDTKRKWIRIMRAGEWQSWEKFYTTEDKLVIDKTKDTISNMNVDYITGTGEYIVVDCNNIPLPLQNVGWGYLSVKNKDNDWIFQEFKAFGGGGVNGGDNQKWFRVKSSGVWSNWVGFLIGGANYTNLALNKSSTSAFSVGNDVGQKTIDIDTINNTVTINGILKRTTFSNPYNFNIDDKDSIFVNSGAQGQNIYLNSIDDKQLGRKIKITKLSGNVCTIIANGDDKIIDSANNTEINSFILETGKTIEIICSGILSNDGTYLGQKWILIKLN